MMCPMKPDPADLLDTRLLTHGNRAARNPHATPCITREGPRMLDPRMHEVHLFFVLHQRTFSRPDLDGRNPRPGVVMGAWSMLFSPSRVVKLLEICHHSFCNVLPKRRSAMTGQTLDINNIP